MVYEVKSPILGFENVQNVELENIDETFVRLRAMDNTFEMTLINPYVLLKEYNFTIPTALQILLELEEGRDKVEVYCPLVLQNPVQDSEVGFSSPFVFNPAKGYVAQVSLDIREYPELGITKPIKAFLPQELLESLGK
ncbi:flagellar assembly protein FliW [uncultured Helicobacter sp.]|uniref:flagellar assembly protein FliW n=1 Tax=uncultured Helicobacter sp. TaxID=175537 RepID=UPI001C3B076F|nr:flagellar assembly protein FliW [Candidatus Helicobacter avicola]